MKKGIRNLLIIGLLIVIGVVAWVVVRNRSKPTSSGQITPVQVRLKWLHQAQFAGFYVAKDKGFYEHAGLAVTLNAGGVDFPAIQLVAGGGEQFGVTGADQLLLAREKGAPVVALATIYRRSPMVFFALDKSDIAAPKDFVGRKVGVKLGGNEELTYRAMLSKAGVDAKRITEIPVKYDMTPLFNGQVAVWPGYLINEVIVAEEQGFKVKVIQPADYGVDLYADTLFTTESMIRDHPDTVRKFVHATLQGWQYAIDHPQEAVDDTLHYSDKLNRDHEYKMLQASIPLLKPDSKPIGWMDLMKWQEMEQLLKNQGFLKTDIDVTKVFTDQFLTQNQ
jgi:NitT/TauT family transport system substrate-binding protein